jgi:hypothetical protein
MKKIPRNKKLVRHKIIKISLIYVYITHTGFAVNTQPPSFPCPAEPGAFRAVPASFGSFMLFYKKPLNLAKRVTYSHANAALL